MSKLADIVNRTVIKPLQTPGGVGNLTEMQKQIKALMLEIIGEDEEPGRIFGPGVPSFQRDQLRAELRKRVEAL